MKSDSFDVIIAGGGMVGLALAIALAKANLRTLVVEKIPFEQHQLPEFDGRVSAIAAGSVRLFEGIGAWDAMRPHAEPIRDIRVVDGATPFFLHYDCTEVGAAAFGYIVENRHIRVAMLEAAANLPSLTLRAPAAVTRIDTQAYHAEVTLDDGSTHRTALIVAADGKSSKLRTLAGIRAHEASYPHSALVCTIGHSKPHHGLALERFFPAGPFAVLPMQNNRSSLVWTEKKENIGAFTSLPPAELAQEIRERVGDYLGEITPQGKCFTYPLSVLHAARYIAPRFALVGDAAHAIHPIAGQGVNLGLRDVAALAEILVDAQRAGQDIGNEAVLEQYVRWRRFDSLTMIAVTDGLTRLFSTSALPVRVARDAGLWTVGKITPLKRFFMRHAMGTTGDLPRLMRGEAL